MQDYLPPAAQDMLEEIEELQAEAEDVVAEREAAADRLEDAEAALEALEDAEDGDALFRSVGTVRIETGRGEARTALEDEIERLEARIESLDEEEGRLREQFENRKEDIQHLLGGGPNDPGKPGTVD